MSREDPTDPPSNWCHFPVTQLTDRLYYGWPDGEDKPWFWHWCTAHGRWVGAGSGRHDLISRDPLHLEPSLFWPDCCGMHGWVRDGAWTSV